MSSLFQSTPDGWQRTTLRHLAQGPKNGAWGSEAGEDEIDAVCVRVADFDWSRLTLKLDDPTTRSFKKQQFKNLQLQPGDIVIEKSGGGEKTPVGRVVSFDGNVEAVTSNFVARIRPHKDVWNRFFLYLLASHYMSGYSHQFIKQNTGIQNLDDTNLFRSDVWVPDRETQRQIADFLDRETARIDLLIEKKQRLVALLGDAYFIELENATFPLGLPEHELVPFRWVCRIAQGQVDPTSDSWKSRILIAPNHIESKTGRILATETAEEQGAISGKYAFRAGTVLYSKIRPALAKACISPSAGMCSADMYPIIPDKRLRPEYLLMQLLSARFTDWATMESMRVAMPKINRETLGGFRLRVPSHGEQDRAITAFDKSRSQFETVTDKINASIDRLKEYRSALITAAVTGQIDVQAATRTGAADRRLDALQEEMDA